MSDLIISPGEAPHIKGVESDLDSIGRGNAESIDGNRVVLTYSRGEVGAGTDYPLSGIPDSKR